MIELDDQQEAARDWFEALRDRICAEFEKIEAEAGSDARFTYTPRSREWLRILRRPPSAKLFHV